MRNKGRAALPRLAPSWAVLLFGLMLCFPTPLGKAEGIPYPPAGTGVLAEQVAPPAEQVARPVAVAALSADQVAPPAEQVARSDVDAESADQAKSDPTPEHSVSPELDQHSGTDAAASKSGSKAESSLRIFNTVEFRGELKNMPKWQRVASAEKKQRTFDRADLNTLMRGSVYKQWLELVDRAKTLSTLEKAKAVTTFFNRWPYRTDQDVYKLADYWATPAEFLARSGDCEDYAITKFYALVKLGVDPSSMRIVALRDTIRNLAHAVLVIYTDNDVYVLDNLTNMVLSHERYQHYWPQYSINEIYRWAHIRPKKK